MAERQLIKFLNKDTTFVCGPIEVLAINWKGNYIEK